MVTDIRAGAWKRWLALREQGLEAGSFFFFVFDISRWRILNINEFMHCNKIVFSVWRIRQVPLKLDGHIAQYLHFRNLHRSWVMKVCASDNHQQRDKQAGLAGVCCDTLEKIQRWSIHCQLNPYIEVNLLSLVVFSKHIVWAIFCMMIPNDNDLGRGETTNQEKGGDRPDSNLWT